MSHAATAAASPRVSSGSRSERDRGFERRLVVLMAARLVLSAVSLGVTLGLEAAGENFTTAEWRGLYATIAFAFLATIVYGVVLNRVVHPRRFAALNVVTDIAIVTALVQFSGGHDSVFPFLYVLVAAYGAFLFEFRGAMGTADEGGIKGVRVPSGSLRAGAGGKMGAVGSLLGTGCHVVPR